ncbi:MAG: imidazolonepropionase [Candidatus Krumholzibacteria bacterium]|nr:imidazolonepropionase [Candidatus Krumholzibacteria bacterium]MDH4336613.1 imidazolonepropionase [Candidatus Krumholzibacteria bacterium]MDH5268956.1 imidazolonepropionase [Candidatus Krumholzibacteria bacterium]MDH5627457.1 imidazolonepropionase [Candidatus Krumholzibacteria bacterium]
MSARPAADLILTDASQLLTLAHPAGGPRVGPALGELAIVSDGALAACGGRIVASGSRDAVLGAVDPRPDCRQISAGGRVVMPGFVDCHTHTVFARYRLDEYAWRVAGTPYEEIAARGGGIAKSVEHIRATPEPELERISRERLAGCIAYGTTTIEIKSGYGLDFDNEMKQLRVIRKLAESFPITVVATFLGAHAIPREHARSRAAYVAAVVDEMIPAVAAANLAEFNDVFCETGVFTLEETERILRSGQRAGLKARLHADELTDMGAAELAAAIGAVSADHLKKISERGISRMVSAGVFGVLLPGTSFGLPSLSFAPARRMVEAGMRLAIASDFNPGSSTSESMPMMTSIACSHMRLSPAEAISMSTYNPAFVLGREGQVGSLEAGKRADFLLLNCTDYREVPNHFGVNPVAQVFVAGAPWNGDARGVAE